MNRLKTVVLLGLLTGLLLLIGDAIGGSSGLAFALFFAALTNVGAWWFSDRIVLALHRAREIPESEAPRLHAIVTELASRAGIPKPRVYLTPDPSPNAFATGRSPSHAALAVTSGLLSILDEYELRGVLAHEIGHIRSRDTLITTVAATVAGAISVLARMVFFFGMGSRGDQRRNGGGVGALGLVIVSPILALLLQLAVSRSREFHADDEGSDWVGSGEPLVRALTKLDRAAGRIPSTTAQPTLSSLYIVNPFRGGISRLFSTHPSTEERIRRLMRKTPGAVLPDWRPIG